MNATATTVGSWETSKMRSTWLPAILDTFPTNVKSAIKEVDKVSFQFEDSSEQTTADKLWIPSSQEVGMTGNYKKETNGVVYDGIFTSTNSTRIKTYNKGSAGYWWLRSAYSASFFVQVSSNGTGYGDNANLSGGVALGFCI